MSQPSLVHSVPISRVSKRYCADHFIELDPEDAERVYRCARLHCRMYAELESMLEDPDKDINEQELATQTERFGNLLGKSPVKIGIYKRKRFP